MLPVLIILQYHLMLENFINKLGCAIKVVPPPSRQSDLYILKAPMNYTHSNQVHPRKSHSAIIKLIVKIYIKNQHPDVHIRLKQKRNHKESGSPRA